MDFPLWSGGNRFETPSYGTNYGISVTAAGSAHTKGSYVNLIASTSYPAMGFFVYFYGAQAAGYTVDIAIGSAGNEIVIVPDLYFDQPLSGNIASGFVFVPMAIPAGTRLSARCQCTSASGVIRVGLFMLNSAFSALVPYQKAAMYGVNTGTTRATAIDCGGSANTKGSWVQLAASVTDPVKLLFLILGNQLRTSLTATTNTAVDIGIGAAASEVVLVPDLLIHGDANSNAISPHIIGPIPVNLPAGTRLAVRGACNSTTTTTSRNFDAALLTLG